MLLENRLDSLSYVACPDAEVLPHKPGPMACNSTLLRFSPQIHLPCHGQVGSLKNSCLKNFSASQGLPEETANPVLSMAHATIHGF